ncbi:MAG: GNAT family N-acetyltransferase [Gammaproteobacteria bacterium]|nr:GNAT family N-acetyltransferase [Gammaproteobacteria bacterium]
MHHNHRARAADVFGRIINKAPMRCAVSGAKLKSNAAYYWILRFIEARCRSCSGAVDRALMDGRMRLPRQITVEADAQVYRLNWLSRLDRRNVELSTYCTVDAESRFVLGMHANFDSNVDPFETNASAARKNELEIPEAFREHAHYWLAGDELKAGRAMERDGDIVGFCVTMGPLVDLLMVAPAHQRRGIGRVLLADAEARLFVEHAAIR